MVVEATRYSDKTSLREQLQKNVCVGTKWIQAVLQNNQSIARLQSSAESLLVDLLPAEPSLHLLDFGLLKRALHDSSKVFVQFVEHSNSRALATAGSVMTIGV